MSLDNPFNDTEDPTSPQTGPTTNLNDVRTLQVGIGAESYRVDRSGLWLGANRFADAPFSVNMQGDLIANSATLGNHITIDETGIVINDGALTIKDDTGTTIIDGGGLVSAANFPFSSVTGSSTQTTTSTSYQDIVGLSATFTLARSQQIFVSCIFSGFAYFANLDTLTDVYASFILDVDGAQSGSNLTLYSQIRQSPVSGPASTQNFASTASFQTVLTLAAGSHTLKLRFKTADAAYTAQCNRSSTNLTYFRMGA